MRGKVERIVLPSNSLTFRLTVFACEPFDDELTLDWLSFCKFKLDSRSLSRSTFRASACALRSALSASIRALIRANSSASSRFFFFNASREACRALSTEVDDGGLLCSDFGTAFCLPFACDDGVEVIGGVDCGACVGSWFGVARSTFLFVSTVVLVSLDSESAA